MFSMPCSNKGCGKVQEPYIDPKDDKVYCSLCNKEITNITFFAKSQMKSLKQYKPKTATSFAVKCDKCGKEARPKLVNNEVVCSGCNKPLDKLSVPFRNMLKEKLRTVDKDVA
mgnify:CR=1 FL=1|jgi:uncharacterized protein with PIN domain